MTHPFAAIPRHPEYRLREGQCAWCAAYPCRCESVRFDACACGTDVRTRPASALEDYRTHLALPSHVAWRDRQ